MIKRASLSPEQALQKLRHYCGYQERCHQEVREKLYAFGLHRNAVEDAVATLIQEDMLNEERFAIQFAGGHFRLRQWGRIKIRYELRLREISDYCIDKALAALDEEAYHQTLAALAAKKWESLGGSGHPARPTNATSFTGRTNATNATSPTNTTDDASPAMRRHKTQEYLLQKGYEPDLIAAAIKDLLATAGSPPPAAG